MASDYKKIAEEHRVGYGSFTEYRSFFYEQLYKEKTHFVYEFIQNAVDSKSSQLELRLGENELFVWNDGDQFNEKDVRSICSLGSSSKDLTQIGTFGIGFKSVYNYTDYPEIYSDDEHFRIRDLTQPEGIDKMTPQIVEQVSQGRTVFRLPFKDDLSKEDIVLLKDQFCKLGERYVLLFLRDLHRDFKRHFKTIRWIDERDGQTGICSCAHHRHSKIQDASEVELTMSLNGENQLSEMFLVFHKTVQPPQHVIDALLKQAKHDEKRQKIQQSAKKQQPIEIAFKLHDGSITAMDDNSVLFAYLPTQKETHLKFLIQARYQTTSGRADIQDPSENPWNKWLVQETAKFLPEILEQLKASDLLEPAFFNVLPLREDDKVPLDFEPIVKALEDAMGEKPLVPTQDGGYAKAENVFYPESTPLRNLVKSSGMHSDSSLLHPYIRKDAKESERCFDVMAKAGVKEIKASDLLCWLEEQSCKWFKNRTNKWLCSLYIYFNRKWSKSELERIKELPLVRLDNGEHVSVSDQLVYFPPKTDEDLEDIKPLLNDLRILKSTLLKKEGYNDIKAFLRDIGVEELNPKNLISESICPLYRQPDKPSAMKNRRHVRYIFKSWQKLQGSEHSRLEKVIAAESERSRLEESVSEVPILRAYKGTQRKTPDFVVPCNAYLPQAYTGDDDLETYFSVADGAPWFVDDKYLTKNSDTKAWFRFLKAIGVMDTPRVIPKKIVCTFENYQEFDEEITKRNIKSEYSTQWGGKTNIEDFYLQGLSGALDKIGKYGKVDFSRVIWRLLVKMVSPLPSEESRRNIFFRNFFQGTYHWFHYSPKSKPFNATFYSQLKEVKWLPDEQGELRIPSDCFVPTSENRDVLGDSEIYLRSDFDISTRSARWLAEKLDIHLKADLDGVLNYLQSLSLRNAEVSVDRIELLYAFLAQHDICPTEKFKQESLIFTCNPEPRWWKADEVFWEDESAVFGDDRGYLKAHYSEDLKSFFTNFLGISKHAAPLDYVRGIKDVASTWQIGEEIRERVKILYDCLWLSLQENEDLSEDEEWQEEWEQVREDACWLGRTGDEWGFFLLEELVWNDHNYCAEVVEGEVPFWAFGDNLLEFAKHLGVEGCYQASNIECDPYSDQGECTIESEKVQKLVPYIRDFLNSTPWRGVYSEEETTEILDRLSVRRAQKLKVSYELKGTSVPDPNPRQSFLDPTSQGTILWLGLEESEGAYPDLIGDALQDHFGINELREFIKDLLLTIDPHGTTLLNWERRGFQADLCLLPPGSDSKENENMLSESVDEKLLSETGSRDDLGTNDYEVETSTVHEESETENGNGDSTTDESVTSVYPSRPGSGGTRPRSGNRSSTPNRNRDTGYSGGGGGSGPSEKHEALKDYIADNLSELGSGLKLVKKEHTFKLGGRVDILLEDNSGNPVPVEVKPYHIPPESNDEVWQAVRYKHVAAAEYGLRCDQVRSILVAPVIHNDVKTKCEKLGIEAFEVPQI